MIHLFSKCGLSTGRDLAAIEVVELGEKPKLQEDG
jgi:hypothetical protein